MSRFDPRAITIATLLSLALDVLGGLALAMVLGPPLTEGMSQEELNAALKAVSLTQEFLLASLVYGTATTVFGGYVAARLARRTPYFNAMAVGVLGIVLGLMVGADDTPGWALAAAYLLNVPAAVLGGHLAQAKRA
jgi:hypothetical protein